MATSDPAGGMTPSVRFPTRGTAEAASEIFELLGGGVTKPRPAPVGWLPRPFPGFTPVGPSKGSLPSDSPGVCCGSSRGLSALTAKSPFTLSDQKGFAPKDPTGTDCDRSMEKRPYPENCVGLITLETRGRFTLLLRSKCLWKLNCYSDWEMN